MERCTFSHPLAILLSCLALACATDDGGDDGVADGTTLGASEGASDPDDDGTSSGESAATVASQESSADSGSASASSDDGSEGESESEADATTDATTGGPTSGPGVLPGETGLEAFCRRYVECGGTYYDGEQACIDAAYDYWGDCPSRAAALDTFGACMSEMECTDWSPDAYNPASTPCAEQWQGVGASEPCD